MQHIQNGRPNSQDVLRYRYRKIFHLTEVELENESVDTFYLNLTIDSEIAKQQEREANHG